MSEGDQFKEKRDKYKVKKDKYQDGSANRKRRHPQTEKKGRHRPRDDEQHEDLDDEEEDSYQDPDRGRHDLENPRNHR